MSVRLPLLGCWGVLGESHCAVDMAAAPARGFDGIGLFPIEVSGYRGKKT